MPFDENDEVLIRPDDTPNAIEFKYRLHYIMKNLKASDRNWSEVQCGLREIGEEVRAVKERVVIINGTIKTLNEWKHENAEWLASHRLAESDRAKTLHSVGEKVLSGLLQAGLLALFTFVGLAVWSYVHADNIASRGVMVPPSQFTQPIPPSNATGGAGSPASAGASDNAASDDMGADFSSGPDSDPAAYFDIP